MEVCWGCAWAAPCRNAGDRVARGCATPAPARQRYGFQLGCPTPAIRPPPALGWLGPLVGGLEGSGGSHHPPVGPPCRALSQGAAAAFTWSVSCSPLFTLPLQGNCKEVGAGRGRPEEQGWLVPSMGKPCTAHSFCSCEGDSAAM